MNPNRQLKILILFVVVLSLVGCSAAIRKDVTPEDAHKLALLDYDKALKWYTRQARLYEIHYQAASPELQARWKEKVDPVFYDAKDALDAWGKIVKSGSIGQAENADFEEQYTKLVLLGLDFLEDR